MAWGMIAANAIAVDRGLLPRDEAACIDRTILAYQPSPLPRLSREEVLAATEHDKKNTGSARVMVFPRRVGGVCRPRGRHRDRDPPGIDVIPG